MQNLTQRRRYEMRRQDLKVEANSWMAHWRELSEYISPRTSRFLGTETNKGGKKNQSIINSTPTRANRVLASGMMAGITSPARPWFRITTPDPRLAEFGTVKRWLFTVEDRIRTLIQRSNLYNCLHQVYSDLGTYGITALHIDEDWEDIVRGYVFPVGQYLLANSARNRVDTIFREVGMTVGQLVERFTLEKCSDTVRRQFQAHKIDQWHNIIHVVEPNRESTAWAGGKGPAGMAYKSAWYEMTGSDTSDLLLERGYEEFPVMCPRWTVTGEDVYGSSPGMEALGDSRALQILEKRAAQAYDKIISPPMRAPVSMQNQRATLIPGDVTFVDGTTGNTYEPAMRVDPNAVTVGQMKIREHEQRINACFFADLWLMMANEQGQMTAREVSARSEEKMLQLGPVMERLQDELLDPLIDRCFQILMRGDYLPPPPEELAGGDLRVEYISVMAQAQKLIGITGMEKLAGFTLSLAGARQNVLDKIDFDQMIDHMGGMLGVPPDVVRTDEDVAAIRQSQAQMAQQQAQMQQMTVGAQTAKTLSEAESGGENMLNQLLSGMGAPQVKA